ncbi:saccharopine dehydrogenase [Streptomyces sp. FH025]|uniref:saccharopine dehydrogenase n=1 Tax=Streptomyces sp. FH025 TaxID=2815937 RepID=UPI001A9D1FB6|nr:saccharopine dehydrogenase [Streptomyces sp. FH025]MBO1418310.1 saccharopine dehydrogenase [Streptomyces sp. FH025]
MDLANTNDNLAFDPEGPVLLVGGYGTVGAELARMAAADWPLLLTGRSEERGAALARELGDAAVRRWDLADPAPFAAAARAVVSVVNDPDDRVLRAAARAGVPYVDVTRWTTRLQRAATVAALLRPTAPVLLSSAWMGGVTGLVTAALAERLGGAERVEVAIRWDLADRAGADSVEFMDRLGLDYEVVRDGRRSAVAPLSGPRTVRIGDFPTKVAGIDTPEQFTLPLTLGTTTATTRIGFSSQASTTALLAAKHVGFFRWGRGDRFRSARHAMLYSPGEGGVALLRIDVSHAGRELSALVEDAAGQAHLTAVGALLGLRRALGADGAEPPSGVAFPEQTPRPEQVLADLAALGVTVKLRSDERTRAAA